MQKRAVCTIVKNRKLGRPGNEARKFICTNLVPRPVQLFVALISIGELLQVHWV